eukprot:11188496-Lingulodinium_polyedra.AAC.1
MRDPTAYCRPWTLTVRPAATKEVITATRPFGARNGTAGCSLRVAESYTSAADARTLPCRYARTAASTAAGSASP